jgi:hypothetical protein
MKRLMMFFVGFVRFVRLLKPRQIQTDAETGSVSGTNPHTWDERI